MSAFTGTIASINGYVNLRAALKTAGYDHGGGISHLRIFNPSASPIYIHANEDGVTAPSSGAAGYPVCTDTAVAPSSVFEIGREQGMSGLDTGTTWIYSAGAHNLAVMVIGA